MLQLRENKGLAVFSPWSIFVGVLVLDFSLVVATCSTLADIWLLTHDRFASTFCYAYRLKNVLHGTNCEKAVISAEKIWSYISCLKCSSSWSFVRCSWSTLDTHAVYINTALIFLFIWWCYSRILWHYVTAPFPFFVLICRLRYTT
jgi:hypothetical protein